MATLTREQMVKWSSALADGWKFDAQRYIMWGDKQTFTDGPADDSGVFYRVTLEYHEERTGHGWTATATGYQLPTVKLDRYTPTSPESPLYSVVEIFRETVGEKQKKRNYNYLAKLTASLDVSGYLTRAAELDTGKQYNDLSDLMTEAEEEPDDFYTEIHTPAEEAEQEEHDTGRPPYSIPAAGHPETIHTEIPGYMMSDYSDPAEEATEAARDAPETEPAPEHAEPAQEPETATEGAQSAAPDMFAQLAAAYFTGRSVKPSKPAPEPEPEPAPEEPEPEPAPVGPGYAENDNYLLPDEARAALLRGETFTRSEAYHNTLYYSAPYSDRVRLVYSMTVYDRDNPTPGRDFEYYGFMIGADLYANGNRSRIIPKYRDDVDRRLLELVPSEEDAAALAAGDKYDRDRAERLKECDFTRFAQDHFFRGKRPELHLYAANNPSIDTLICYLLDPLAEIDRAAHEYMELAPGEIYCDWIEYNRTREAYERITGDPASAEHIAMKISKAITNQQTVRLELTNGHEVKAEASAVKNITFCGCIYDTRVSAADRQFLDRNEYGRAKDIYPADIVAIRHGGRTLYEARTA